LFKPQIHEYYLLLIITSLLFSSCEIFEGSSHIDADDSNIEYIGRFDFSNPKIVRFDWPGVQIRTRFEGTSCSIKLKDGNNDYNVFIDGRLHNIFSTTEDTIYVLANGIPNKVHSLLITKRTEALFGTAAFEGFILDGGKELVKLDNESIRKIEFIGDSYFTGFGIEGDSPDCVFSRETENSYLSFGPQLARKLNGEYSIVAISGIGAVRNYADSNIASLNPLPYYYERACMNETTRWQFKGWQPDLVVIRLGRNDYWSSPFPPRSVFRTGYLDLLKKIRVVYPNTNILALCGPIRKDPHCAYIKSAVLEMQTKMKDKKIKFLKMDLKLDPKKDFGCQKHPNASGHKKIADLLEPVIRKWLKW